jgi:hypothetical protein
LGCTTSWSDWIKAAFEKKKRGRYDRNQTPTSIQWRVDWDTRNVTPLVVARDGLANSRCLIGRTFILTGVNRKTEFWMSLAMGEAIPSGASDLYSKALEQSVLTVPKPPYQTVPIPLLIPCLL